MSGAVPSSSPDRWTAQAYKASSSFVPLLTTRVTQWLDPQPSDRIIDLGCGDGVLTVTFKPLCAQILGVDSSPNLIAAAEKDYADVEGIRWLVLDGRSLEKVPELSEHDTGFDKVFSNAALHWILRDPSKRSSTINNVFRLLRPGGKFVFEMGGPANVAEVHTALISALIHRGIPIEEARDACPWYFPSEHEMKALLQDSGFSVEKMEVEYRPTRLTEGIEGGGLQGWVRLHGQAFLEAVNESQRDAVVAEVCSVLETVIGRPRGEGGQWLGYVRLRAVAVR